MTPYELDEGRQGRSGLRRLVKRVLRKYGYPPDKQEEATQTVLEQAEVLLQSERWVTESQ
jgi:type I restriction enzyme R subunit